VDVTSTSIDCLLHSLSQIDRELAEACARAMGVG